MRIRTESPPTDRWATWRKVVSVKPSAEGPSGAAVVMAACQLPTHSVGLGGAAWTAEGTSNARDVAVPTRPIARRDRIRLITGVLSLGLSRADLSITHASTGVVPVTRSRRPTAGGQDERPRSRDKRSGPLLQKGFAVGEAFSRCGGRMGGRTRARSAARRCPPSHTFG